ncbi:hypothetical protein Pelo_4675 [Pelomyxa schiedti]|nr:hypothetical protein Pelo_4675 [Pelomyxa schiedti]
MSRTRAYSASPSPSHSPSMMPSLGSPLSSSPSMSPLSPRNSSAMSRRASLIAAILPISFGSPPSTVPEVPSPPPPVVPNKNAGISDGVREILNKHVSKLPVSKDWLRLGHTFRVFDLASGAELFNSDTDTSDNISDLEKGFAMLRAVYTAAETEENAVALEQLFRKHVTREDLDFTEQFQKFLEEVDDELPTIKAIKCICQDVIYPAVMYYKRIMDPKYPFKDSKGTWHIDVGIRKHRTRRTTFTVTHHKGQLSHEVDMFSFEWNLEMDIRSSGDIQAQLNVMDYQIGGSVAEPQKSELTSIFQSELHPIVPFQKFLTQVPFAVRPWTLLSSGVSIIQNGTMLYQSAVVDSVTESKYQIACTIAQFLDGVEHGPLLTRVVELHQRDGFVNYQDFQLQPHFLKCIALLSQDFIYFAYKRLRSCLHERFPFKDKRDSIREANLKFGSTHITVCHRKVEQSGAQQFEFSWELQAKLTTNFELIKTDLRITSYTFFDTMSLADRNDWLLAASSLINKHSKEIPATPVSILCALRACCTALESKSTAPMVLVPGLELPLEATSILSEVINSLSQCPNLPLVHLRQDPQHS